MPQPGLLYPDWPAPNVIRAAVTTRQGGFSTQPWQSLNLGLHVGDDPETVQRNRALVGNELSLPAEPVWLDQVHGATVIDAAKAQPNTAADAAWTDRPGVVCAVLTADCLPVFFTSREGDRVAVAHAGWRGLASGVLEATVESLGNPAALICWLGPAIGPADFEVGDEVRDQFLSWNSQCDQAFTRQDNGKWLADIYQLARLRLRLAGIEQISGGNFNTFSDTERFFSYRRDGQTGRMASLIWRQR